MLKTKQTKKQRELSRGQQREEGDRLCATLRSTRAHAGPVTEMSPHSSWSRFPHLHNVTWSHNLDLVKYCEDHGDNSYQQSSELISPPSSRPLAKPRDSFYCGSPEEKGYLASSRERLLLSVGPCRENNPLNKELPNPKSPWSRGRQVLSYLKAPAMSDFRRGPPWSAWRPYFSKSFVLRGMPRELLLQREDRCFGRCIGFNIWVRNKAS